MVMKAQGAMKVKFHVFLILSLDGCKYSAAGFKETAHSNHQEGPRARCNMVMKEVSSSPLLIRPTYSHYKLEPFHLKEEM
jgi:hypothetical protein